MELYDDVIILADRLTLAEKVRLMEHLSTSLKHDLEIEGYKHITWEQFINLTYGSLADDPIERGDQPALDIRDEIE